MDLLIREDGKYGGWFGLGMGIIMECSQDGGILPVNHILLNNCSMTSNDFDIDICFKHFVTDVVWSGCSVLRVLDRGETFFKRKGLM